MFHRNFHKAIVELPYRPIVAFDFDDVIIPYTAGFLDWHNRMYSTSFSVNEVVSHAKIHELLGTTVEEYKVRNKTYHLLGSRRNQRPIEGFLEAALHLSIYYDFVLISAGNSESFVTAYLRNNRLHRIVSFKKILCGVKDKGLACRQLRAVALVDDRPSFIKRAAPHIKVGLLFNLNGAYAWSTWSEGCAAAFPNVQQVTDWKSVTRVLLSHIGLSAKEQELTGIWRNLHGFLWRLNK
eukprot:Gregarina_sp_Pseudo_9__5155@NODE_549_length_2597_cov_18_668882_g519_i0_p2_GENE_NODE_549_length_2597_cov_18_668882_g519_i0NODE_549_length_2597_cov_18_668882_g519_i0_p2_ORF_typecomplete_len238_score1_09NT5C/PF06941_12/1_4e15_NODE_549_length_2597_cov_18_668882_g519_i055768